MLGPNFFPTSGKYMAYYSGNSPSKDLAMTHLTSPASTAGKLHLLVVDEDLATRAACAEIAASMGFVPHQLASAADARRLLRGHAFDVVLLELRAPHSEGLLLLDEVKSLQPETAVLVMHASGSIHSAVEAMRNGAADYLTKPFAVEELSSVLERVADCQNASGISRALRERLRVQQGVGSIIGHSPEMEKLYRILAKVAQASHPVLILGESGTGKELVARSIHSNGPKANKPFIPVDCGSLVPSLIESELFGYVKGAFTGANRSKDGLLATAEGGTVFLDEIGELPLDLQAKLLRALQEKEIRPVGATHRVAINVRILAATNRDLAQMVEKGGFRKDLYYRLNVVNLRIPSLRERPSDIPMLAGHFVERQNRAHGTSFTLSDDSLRAMAEYSWPGNVRELENAIEHCFSMSSGPVLHMKDMPTQLQNHMLQCRRSAAEAAAAKNTPEQLSEDSVTSLAELEKETILTTLSKLKGDKLRAAQLLGIGKTTLYRKLKEYGICEELTLHAGD
jgi:DNA-binding NtrC family response regulator